MGLALDPSQLAQMVAGSGNWAAQVAWSAGAHPWRPEHDVGGAWRPRAAVGAGKHSKRWQLDRNDPKTTKPGLPWLESPPSTTDLEENRKPFDFPMKLQWATKGRSKGTAQIVWA
ncbi:hypothetical protein V6N12_063422 [Hibiscus sabdariffa]|uniref:Uncharacterized protein n=1 Tax=Hibiscus sabdariffa TaxID=183260 RepID=A0ABR2FBU1_9ROSI